MAAVQRERWNAFSVQRAIREQLAAPGKITGLIEYELLSYIWEKTWAAPRPPEMEPVEWFEASQSALASALGCSDSAVREAVNRLIEAGIIEASQGAATLRYKLTPDRWADAPKKGGRA